MSSELEDLLVDGTEIDKKLVAEVLSPFIRIDKNSCEIRPLGNWNQLQPRKKVLLYLLARKAMLAMKMDIDEEAATAKEITDKTGVVGGTTRRNLRELLDERVLAQTKQQKYHIQNYAIEKVKEMIVGD